jgi:hypothetical protein
VSNSVKSFRDIAKHRANLQAFVKSLVDIVVCVCNLIYGGVTFDKTGLVRREEVVGYNIIIQVFVDTLP